MNTELLFYLYCMKWSMLSFGGFIMLLADIQHALVSDLKLLSNKEFLDGFALAQLQPGPNVLAFTLYGYFAFGVRGGVLGFVSFIALPLVLTGLAGLYWHSLKHSPWFNTFTRVLKPIAQGLLFSGLLALGKVALGNVVDVFFMLLAAVLVYQQKISPLYIILGIGIVITLLASWLKVG